MSGSRCFSPVLVRRRSTKGPGNSSLHGCLDQLKAGLAFRPAYRRALGLLPGQRLFVVSSTWGQGSVLGSPQADVLRRALAELPADEFRVLAAVHPNAWYGHGAWQIHSWLAPLIDAGLMLPRPETEVWKAALRATVSIWKST
jgi:hypothetical protein